MSIEAIGFDIGGVIFPDLHVPVEGPMAQELSIPSKVASQLFDEVYLKLAVGGRGSEDELWEKLRQVSKREVSVAELRERYREFLTPEDEVVALIKKLSRDYSLLTVTNTVQEWFDYELDHFQLRSFFKAHVTSFEAGVRKPRPGFFEVFVSKLESLNYLPEACLFIDDRQKNTRAPAKLGFQTAVFKSLSDLKAEFQKCGVSF